MSASGLALGGCLDDSVSSIESETSSFNPVTYWAHISNDAILRLNDGSPALSSPCTGLMLEAQVQDAVYDTLLAIDDNPAYYPFSYTDHASNSTSRDAAVATVSYRILHTRIPGRAAFLDDAYATALAKVPDGNSKNKGIALGEDVARHYLDLRADDHLFDNPTWVQPPTGPGIWEPTAPTPPVDYKCVFVPPFTININDVPMFYPIAPPALTSAQYTTDYIETKDYGRVDSAIRSEDQKQQALWSGEQSFRWGSRNMIALADATELSTSQAARYLAMVFTITADAVQVGMSAKYNDVYWRPFHAIPRGDTDGNPDTIADPTWSPLLNVNHPEYPAGHGFYGGGSIPDAVQEFFGTRYVTWTMDAIGVAGLTQPVRTYTNLDNLRTDMVNMRVWAGLHWRNSVVQGQNMSRVITDHITDNYFRRRRN